MESIQAEERIFKILRSTAATAALRLDSRSHIFGMRYFSTIFIIHK